MVDLTLIENADVLRGLRQEDLFSLATIVSQKEFRRKDRLFKRGEAATEFYIATTGCFSLTVDLRFFDGFVEMAVEEKGALDAFGWSSLVEPRTSIYSGYCTEDGSVIAFPSNRLETLMTTRPT